MLPALASAMMVRSIGLVSGSPPLARAATVSSLMMRVSTRPRLASAAPFLCLIVAHFEWPDIKYPVRSEVCLSKILYHHGEPHETENPATAGDVVPSSRAGRRSFQADL